MQRRQQVLDGSGHLLCRGCLSISLLRGYQKKNLLRGGCKKHKELVLQEPPNLSLYEVIQLFGIRDITRPIPNCRLVLMFPNFWLLMLGPLTNAHDLRSGCGQKKKSWVVHCPAKVQKSTYIINIYNSSDSFPMLFSICPLVFPQCFSTMMTRNQHLFPSVFF